MAGEIHIHAESLQGELANVGVLRDRLAERMAAHGIAAEPIAIVSLVATELVTNAIEQSPGSVIDVRLWLDDGIYLAVDNQGSPGHIPDPEHWHVDDPLSERGRGLAIVKHLCDDVWVASPPGRTEVSCRLIL